MNALEQIYYKLTYHHVICCITVWAGSYESIMEQTIVLKNRKLRDNCDAGLCASTNPFYKHSKPLKIEETLRCMVGAYVFKTLKTDRPCEIEYKDQTNYVIRKSVLSLLNVPRVTSVQSSHSFRASRPKIYNVIPLSNRNSRSFSNIRTKM